MCQYLKNPSVSDAQLLQNIFQALNVYYNYSGQASCLNISETTTSNLGTQGWSYQVSVIISSSRTYFSLISLYCNSSQDFVTDLDPNLGSIILHCETMDKFVRSFIRSFLPVFNHHQIYSGYLCIYFRDK